MSVHSDMEVRLEDLIGRQKIALGRIKKMKVNYGKDGEGRKTKHYMKNKIEALQEEWETIRSTQQSITQQFSAEDCKMDYFKNDVYGELKEVYVEFLSELEQYHEDNFGGLTVNTQIVENSNSENHRPKLPTINLTKFNGDYQYWTSFHDLYVTLIHSNDKIPDVQKLYYLKTHLTDEAENLLRHVTVTDSNYESAWETLKNRYENKRVLVNTQLKKLLTQRPLLVEDSEGIKCLLDTTSECLKALQNLNLDTGAWDPIIIFLTTQKLPAETHQMWEHSISKTKDLPTFACLAEFLEARFRTIEAVGSLHFTKQEKHINTRAERQQKQKEHVPSSKSFHITDYNKCCVCNGQHSIRQCAKYEQKDIATRLRIARTNGLCLNCLTPGHMASSCYSTKNCRICARRHHPLLYENRNRDIKVNIKADRAVSPNNPAETSTSSYMKSSTSLHCNISTNILLATAMIQVTSPNGTYTLRALLDQGSQTSFITEAAVQLLRLPKQKIQAYITGIGQNIKESCRSKVKLEITSKKGDKIINMEALVLKTITKLIPNSHVERQPWPHLKGLRFADPNFLQPGKIDILLGADVYSEILSNGLRRGFPNTPVAQNTIFGWVISGKAANINKQTATRTTVVNFHNRVEIDNLLKRFWEIEETPITRPTTEEEAQCEALFEKTHSREENGRYIVKLPFKDGNERPSIGKSRHIAMARFLQTEKRFLHNKKLRESYMDCINEYLQLDHMKPIESPEQQCCNLKDGINAYKSYYLPHHPVMKEESSTTKLRVVFNASQATNSGSSLNDILMTGPTIQEELKAILFRWRFHKYAYSADVEKMYRQIGIAKNQQDYQRLLWRQMPEDEIKEFCLTRVTFGFTSAAFLAIRSLQQLSYDEGGKYPLVKDILINDFYVDNVLSGADTILQAKKQREQLISLLKTGGFPLKKWSASNDTILKDLPEDYKECSTQRDINPTQEIKTLGVLWNPTGDFFNYKFGSKQVKVINTKRSAAAIIAKVFDPLGWCAPVTVLGKILLQSLWLIEVDWDDELPHGISEQFMQYQDSLQKINNIKIPRWLGTKTDSIYEIHGFCDASNKAYAAAIYLKIVKTTGEQKITLLSASTKVSPIKTISLPRLELCGALLLSKLCKYYIDALKTKPLTVYAWTDSTIVLSWLHGHPNKWKCFVAHRVTEIKRMMIGATWRHVPSEDNPADCASRGMTAAELFTYDLWWSGPKWLKERESEWPKSKFYKTTEEIRNIKTLTAQISCLPSFMMRYSKLRTLIRVTAYIYRFINNSKRMYKHKITNWLIPSEIENALLYLIQKNQEVDFDKEIKILKEGKNIMASSRLLKLHPFLDQRGLLRVGGRLQNSNIPYEEKHPLILDDKSFLTELIVRHTHVETLHGGPQLTINTLRQRYWILNVRNTVRYMIHQCVICVKQKGICGQQLMGSLPSPRITESRPFSHAGVDYCGPFNIKLSKGRGTRSQKCYVAIFICLAVKAVHIELVSDLTTMAFLAALKRFTSRRGLPSDIYSDCGSNFVGASRIMERELSTCINEHQEEVAKTLANENVAWHFNPPAAPNFGGLWEAGVKSTKYHLKILINTRLLTFEEMTTVLTQIEASLNSRPISPFTNDIEDFTAITAGHFLIGAPIKSIPEPSLLAINENCLKRWHVVQQISQHFWNRWHKEYLCHLQQRKKWNHVKENIIEGDLVLIKEPNLPPNTWLLGRVMKTYKGNDSLTRVVDIQTKNGILKRPITKICKLPVSSAESPTV